MMPIVCMLTFSCIVGICMRSHSGAAVTAARLRVDLLSQGATWDLGRRRYTLSYSTANVHAAPGPAAGRGGNKWNCPVGFPDSAELPLAFGALRWVSTIQVF
jgi:hypothetical protein